MPPDFSLEQEAGGIIAGVDEVGRGPLAGPVVAAAVIFDRALFPLSELDGLDDSKKMTPRRRDALAALLHTKAAQEHSGIYCAIGEASVAEIDLLNILGATFLAMQRAVAQLPVAPTLALVDGNRPPPLSCAVQCVVKGDSRSLSIAAASVIAKTYRDALMMRLAAEYPGYGWNKNAGYPTKAHRDALQALGVTPHHRRSFGPVAAVIKK